MTAATTPPSGPAPAVPDSGPSPATSHSGPAPSAPESETVVRVLDLRKSYGGRVAVQSADLEVRRGEVFGVLGPNGAGKTSVIEILEGYRRRTSGTVTVLGQDPGHADRRWRNRVGIVPQSGADHEGWRVGELVSQTARTYSDPLAVTEALELVDLADRRRSRVGALSGGQRRRLDLALAVVGRPEVLFLDEPTTGLDPQARRSCWDMIDRLRGEGTTTLLMTHHLDEAERLADRLAVLVAGRVVETAAPAELGGPGTGTEVCWQEGGRTRSVTTEAVGQTLTELHTRLGPDVPGLEIRRPSLESRYLRLIGDRSAGASATVRAPGSAHVGPAAAPAPGTAGSAPERTAP